MVYVELSVGHTLAHSNFAKTARKHPHLAPIPLPPQRQKRLPAPLRHFAPLGHRHAAGPVLHLEGRVELSLDIAEFRALAVPLRQLHRIARQRCAMDPGLNLGQRP